MSDMNVQDLIDDLSEDLTPVRVLAHPALRFSVWALIALVYVLGAMALIGVRADAAVQLTEPVFALELGLMAAISLSAGLASFFLCVPDVRGAGWVQAVPLTLLAVFVFWSNLRGMLGGFDLDLLHWRHCVFDGMVLIAAPLAALIFAGARGASVHPLRLGFFQALSISGLGYAGLRFTCANDLLEHGAFNHILPFVLVGLGIGALARRLFRW